VKWLSNSTTLKEAASEISPKQISLCPATLSENHLQYAEAIAERVELLSPFCQVPEGKIPRQRRITKEGRFAICDLFASLRSTGVVYGVADPGVTGMLISRRGFPICGRSAAQRDVMLAGCRLHVVTSPVVWVRWPQALMRVLRWADQRSAKARRARGDQPDRSLEPPGIGRLGGVEAGTGGPVVEDHLLGPSSRRAHSQLISPASSPMRR
jgi:hypothetical protein